MQELILGFWGSWFEWGRSLVGCVSFLKFRVFECWFVIVVMVLEFLGNLRKVYWLVEDEGC